MSMGVLIERLRRLQAAIDDPMVTEAFLVQSGNFIVRRAKLKAPVKHGTLRRSIAAKVDVPKRRVVVGTWGVKYGAAQEFGGTINVNKKSFMTIPLEPKYEQRSPRKFDLHVAGVAGKQYLVDRQTGQPAYRLVKSVRLRAQPYLMPAFDEYMQSEADNILLKILDGLFDK